MKERKISYTSADALPAKLIMDKDVRDSVANKLIPPIHAQFIPTNYCNLNCSFCSCSEEDRTKQMKLNKAKVIIEDLAELGTKAVTITGGGEPFMHKHINEIITHFGENRIKVGLVTNGLLLRRLDDIAAQAVTWCRISSGDDREFSDDYKESLHKVVTKFPKIDWAFSHVTSSEPNVNTITKLQQFANDHNFTHVRYVADLFNPADVDMGLLRCAIADAGVDDSIAIYQGRKEPRRGSDCYIGYLKPLISADYKVYACCGVQYALKTPSKKLPDELCLGSAFDLEKIMQNSNTPLDGSICARCYYTDYNNILEILLSDIDHKEFV